MEKSRLLEYIIIIGSVVAIVILVFPFLFPIHLFDYEFYTVSKVSEIYKEDIFLSFHWKTANEIITGEPVEVWVEAQLPYNYTDQLQNIEITFDGIGFYAKSSQNYFERISTSEKVEFKSQKVGDRMFLTEPIKLRYAVEGAKDVLYCDYNVKPSCVKLLNIIEVAPHATMFDISMSKIIFVGTIGIFVLTIVVAVFTLRLERYISRLKN